MTAQTGADRLEAVSGAVAQVVEELRAMLFARDLTPGSPVRQEALAARLGVSRAPVREALRVLASEGVLDHVRNVGYRVKVLTAAEFEQTYLMRRVLEAEVLRRLPPFSASALEGLRTVNERIAEASARSDLTAMARLNSDFHFRMFTASGLDLVVAELRRVWQLSDGYRAYLLHDPLSQKRIVDEHAEMVEALRVRDHERLVSLMDHHRDGTRPQLEAVFTPPSA